MGSKEEEGRRGGKSGGEAASPSLATGRAVFLPPSTSAGWV